MIDPIPPFAPPPPPPRRRWLRLIGCWTVFLVILTLVIGVAIAPTLLCRMAPELIARHSPSYMNGLCTVGSVDWGWWGGRIELRDVTIRIDGDPVYAPALTAARLSVVHYALTELLSGDVHLENIEAEGMTVRARRRADGAWNWSHLARTVPAEASGGVPATVKVNVTGPLRLRSHAYAGSISLQVTDEKSGQNWSGTADLAAYALFGNGSDTWGYGGPKWVWQLDTDRSGIGMKGSIRPTAADPAQSIEFEAWANPDGAGIPEFELCWENLAYGSVPTPVNIADKNGAVKAVVFAGSGSDLSLYSPLLEMTAGRGLQGGLDTKGKLRFSPSPRRLSGEAMFETRGLKFLPRTEARPAGVIPFIGVAIPEFTLNLDATTADDGTLVSRGGLSRSGLDIDSVLTVKKFDGVAPEIELTAKGLGDAGQIDPPTRELLGIRPDVSLEGVLHLEAALRAVLSVAEGAMPAIERAEGNTSLAVDNFAVRDADGTRRPLEPAMRIELDADYDRTQGRCTIRNAELRSEAINISAKGAIEGMTGTSPNPPAAVRIADSTFSVHADLDRLQRQCRQFLRWNSEMQLAGTLQAEGTVKGSSAEASVRAHLSAADLTLKNIPFGASPRSLGPLGAKADLEGTLAFDPTGVSRLVRATLASDPIDGEAEAVVTGLFGDAPEVDLKTTFTARPERVTATLGDWMGGLRISGDPITVHLDAKGPANAVDLRLSLAAVRAALTGGPLAERTLSARDATFVADARLKRAASRLEVNECRLRSLGLDAAFVGKIDTSAGTPFAEGKLEWALRPDLLASDLRTWLPGWEIGGASIDGSGEFTGTSAAGTGHLMLKGDKLTLRRPGEGQATLSAKAFGVEIDGAFDRPADRWTITKADLDTDWIGASAQGTLTGVEAAGGPAGLGALRGEATLDLSGDVGRFLSGIRDVTGKSVARQAAGSVHLTLRTKADDAGIAWHATLDGKEVSASALNVGDRTIDLAAGPVSLASEGVFQPGTAWMLSIGSFAWEGAGVSASTNGTLAPAGEQARIDLSVRIRAGADRLVPLLRPWMPSDVQLNGGAMTLDGSVRGSAGRYTFSGAATGEDLRAVGGVLGTAGIFGHGTRLELDGEYDNRSGADTLTLRKGIFVNGGTTGALTGRLEKIRTPTEMSADLRLTLAGDAKTFMRDYPGWMTVPAGTDIGGHLTANASLSGRQGALTAAGKLEWTDFEYVNPTLAAHPVRESTVTLDADTALSFEPFTCEFRRALLTSQTAHGTLGGTVILHPDAYEFRRFTADLKYIPDRLGPILAGFMPGTLSGAEEQPLRIALDGRMTGKELLDRLRAATATMQIGFGTYRLEGLEISGPPLALEMREGRIPLNQTLTVNDGSAVLNGLLDLRTAAAGPSPSRVTLHADKIQLRTDMAAMLSKVNPVFRVVGGSLEGVLGGDLEIRCDRPVSTAEEWKRALAGGGTLGIQNLKITGSPLLGEILMQLGTPGAEAAANALQPIRLSLENGRLSYSDMTLVLNGATLRFSGSVGLDETLDLRMGFPFSPTMLNRNPALQDWLGSELWVPIRGTVSAPRVEWNDLFRDLLKKAAAKAAAKALEELFNGNKKK